MKPKGGFLNTSSNRVKEQQPSKKEPSPPVKLLPEPQETSPTKLADKKKALNDPLRCFQDAGVKF